ncbi:MAG TPA: XrtA system polysaccharide deacetylase [Polyangia bacterium]|nr:XrtA system polysaccharide deacetylase [Polyangia bacterium]
MTPSIFSIDVEDWYHILDVDSAPAISRWDELPVRVDRNFQRLMDILSERQVHATCFFIGHVAKRFPHLVREAARRGHEIASHSYEHRLVYTMTPAEFLEDASRSRKLLEDIAGAPVSGFRASGFSVTEQTPWFFEKLVEAGYSYDSSTFPASRGHGGLKSGRLQPYRLQTQAGELVELPVTVAEVMGKRMCFFGGGYLRLFPYPLVQRMSRVVLGQGRPVIFYVHPREIDPDHPRLPMGMSRRFKTYVNLRTTERKIRNILAEFPVTTFRDYIADNRARLEVC